jgi:hypothetical protein
MTNGQIAQFKELNKCHCIPKADRDWLDFFHWDRYTIDLNENGKKWLRRLWHEYRHQIAAMKRNRK